METTLQYTGRNSNFIEKLVRSKLFWVLLTGFFFAYPILRSVTRELPADLPNYGTVPTFRFTNEFGKPFGSEELKGKVYIANFIFTKCTTMCPALLNKLQSVQHRLRGVMDRAAIVSISVDPENDTPEVLFEKSEQVKAKHSVWTFLTAPIEDTKKLLVEGFKVPMGNKTFANNVMDVAHSNKLVLVDKEGIIRGYYPAEKDSINQLMIDTGLLINKKN